MSSQRFAVFDIGSNSTKVLIASVNRDGSFRKITEEGYTCRLFESGNHKFQSIPNSVIKNLGNVLEKLFEICINQKVSKIVIVATEAIRRAENKIDLIRTIESRFGYQIRILSGEEEALFISRGIQLDPMIKKSKSFQAFDLGGGSLELIEWNSESNLNLKSLPLGVLPMVAEFHSEKECALPSCAEDKLKAKINAEIKQSGLSEDSNLQLVGLGGAVIFLRKILATQTGLGFEKSSVLTLPDIVKLRQQVSQMSLEERIVSFTDLPPDRADVFPVACVIIEEILMNLKKTKLFHSFSNLRYGLLSSCQTNNGLFQVFCQ